MRRIHLFEIEDMNFYPTKFRDFTTDLIQYWIIKFHIYEPVIPLLKKVMQARNTNKIVDLCSGSSGPWLQLQGLLLQSGYPVLVTLTDKYPNIKAFQKNRELSNKMIDFVPESIDATSVPEHIKGIRTIFTGFHHFSPNIAKSILEDVIEKNEAIGIFEFTERKYNNLIRSIFLGAIDVWLSTPFIKPVSWSRFFWTYVIPIVTLVTTWDGIISHLRTYSPQELSELVLAINSEGYVWEIGQLPCPTIKSINITYLIGYPRSRRGDEVC